MKKILFLIFLFANAGINAQISHTIYTGGYYYAPSLLTIDVGDSVIWINDGGNHDVNGNISSINGQPYNNPEISANTHGLDRPCRGPSSINEQLYSSCQPSAAPRVPYILRFGEPTFLPCSGCSVGRST